MYSESQIQDRLVYPHRHEPMTSGVPSSKLRPFRPMDVRATDLWMSELLLGVVSVTKKGLFNSGLLTLPIRKISVNLNWNPGSS